MNNIKISIVMPCYNVEKYVGECLDSLINQSCSLPYEVICVNDGSLDNTPAILKEYSDKYSFIRVINQKNSGLSAARNTGIEYANGEYLCFLDSDDFVEKTYLEKIYSSALENDSDIVVSSFKYYFENDSEKSYFMAGMNEKYESLDMSKRGIISSLFAWNKLFKKSFFDKMNQRFVVGTWYEDIEITTYLFARADRISYVNEPLINYRQRQASIMATVSKRCEELFPVLDRTHKKFKDNGLLEKYYDELTYLFIEQLLIYGQFRFLAMDNYKELVEKCRKQVKNYFPDYLSNKYFRDQSKKYRLLVRFNNKITAPLFRKYLLRNR